MFWKWRCSDDIHRVWEGREEETSNTAQIHSWFWHLWFGSGACWTKHVCDMQMFWQHVLHQHDLFLLWWMLITDCYVYMYVHETFISWKHHIGCFSITIQSFFAVSLHSDEEHIFVPDFVFNKILANHSMAHLATSSSAPTTLSAPWWLVWPRPALPEHHSPQGHDQSNLPTHRTTLSEQDQDLPCTMLGLLDFSAHSYIKVCPVIHLRSESGFHHLVQQQARKQCLWMPHGLHFFLHSLVYRCQCHHFEVSEEGWLGSAASQI